MDLVGVEWISRGVGAVWMCLGVLEWFQSGGWTGLVEFEGVGIAFLE